MTVAAPHPEAERQGAELAAVGRMLEFARGTFSLGIAVCNSVPLRDYLIHRLKSSHQGIAVVSLPQGNPDVFGLACQANEADKPQALFLVGLEESLRSGETDYPVLRALNASRELWPKSMSMPVVIWLPEYAATLLSVHARDFWAWKSHQFYFVSESASAKTGLSDALSGNLGISQYLDADAKRFRMAELEQRIAEAGDPPPAALAHHAVIWLNELGSIHRVLGDYEAALRCWQEALSISEGIGYCEAQAVCLGNIGATYSDLCDWQLAIEYYEKSLKLRQRLGDKAGVALTVCNLGFLYASMGNTQHAMEHFGQALAMASEARDKSIEANALQGLGNIYLGLGDIGRAIELEERSLGIARKIGDKFAEARAVGDLGLAHFRAGDVRKAMALFGERLAIARRIADKDGEAVSLGNLGMCYEAIGDDPKALDCYARALTIAREIGDKLNEAATLYHLGCAMKRAGKVAEALDMAQQAIRLYEEVGHPGAAAVRKIIVEWAGPGGSEPVP